MTFWQFCADSPYLTFFAFWIVVTGICSVVKSMFGGRDCECLKGEIKVGVKEPKKAAE